MNNMTKLAVISDVHGNLLALEAVLEDIYKKNIQAVINLGDSIYGPLWPEETALLLRKHNIIHVLGNEDEIIFTQPLKNPTCEYVWDSISNETLEWLKAIPRLYRLENRFIAFHGTAGSNQRYLIERVTGIKGNEIIIKTDKEFKAELESIPENLILCGHSHMPNIIRLAGGKLIVNPGSVGLQAYDDDMPSFHRMQNYTPYTRYLILEANGTDYNYEMRILNYDYQTAAKLAKKNNREDWTYWLLTGRAFCRG
ncbi:MAG TPA: metallophosphoesterase family protein [Candidatus Deferrimicrobium sp.]|nr:metallophosphoesterase family protein [Candidatus Deferrimicrobium sp.]